MSPCRDLGLVIWGAPALLHLPHSHSQGALTPFHPSTAPELLEPLQESLTTPGAAPLPHRKGDP